MLDVKILAAVFASLAAFAVSFNGGSLDPGDMDLEDNLDDDLEDRFSFGDLTDNPWEKIKDMVSTQPEPENSVKASLTVENLHQQDINIRKSGSLHIDDFRDLSIGVKQVSSDEDIVLHGFRGSLGPGNVSVAEGSFSSLTSSGVNVTGAMSVDEEVNSTVLKVRDIERSPITFTGVGGSIESDSASTQFGDGSRSVEINSFSGDLTVFTQNETVVLDGRVDRLEAGGFSFGG